MTRPSYARDTFERKTTVLLLTVIILTATARSVVVYKQRTSNLHYSRRKSPETALFVSGVFDTPFSPAVLEVRSQLNFGSAQISKPSSETPQEQLQITTWQRVWMIIFRLSIYEGNGCGFARVAHVAVSIIGILGMFSAILGAVLGQWVTDPRDDALEEESFAYWVVEEDDEDGDGTCGSIREEQYKLLRIYENL